MNHDDAADMQRHSERIRPGSVDCALAALPLGSRRAAPQNSQHVTKACARVTRVLFSKYSHRSFRLVGGKASCEEGLRLIPRISGAKPSLLHLIDAEDLKPRFSSH